MNTQNIDNPDNSNPSTPARVLAGSAFSAAFQRRLAEIQAVPEEQLAPPNLDLHAAVTTVRGALPEILKLREGMAQLVGLDQKLIDGLEDYALAAAEAGMLHDIATTPHEDVVALNAEALALRERLRADVAVLAARGLIEQERLATFTGATGYRNVAFELLDYVGLLWNAWPAIEGKTAVTVAELEKGKQLGERLTLVVGLREQAPVVAAEEARVRLQALTLLVRSYGEVRRAISFMRWNEDDVDSIAPSLYAGRPRRQKGEQATAPAATAPGATAAAPAAAAPAAVPPHLAPVAPGMPGGNPFQS